MFNWVLVVVVVAVVPVWSDCGSAGGDGRTTVVKAFVTEDDTKRDAATRIRLLWIFIVIIHFFFGRQGDLGIREKGGYCDD
jgi:hypothetical protein